ncbi:Nif3-like dinuclear metal center hexameric protein [Radiobacillus kanasensis]|uniref:Nif3-like dinuclear metal center hexameric protein n=1 Tax=Radiobacillus kanasensis TaxID=2844358 RepID=UPI001E2CC6D2|nr:Nif3-like dinuclear metal center hexameric protein [Radiobacillus kanasensis]UFT98763.1 Nif3-like dinuclear metal center hexameric protein [Radiobacillus kanasensis]
MAITIGDVMDQLIKPVGVLENTVDTLKFGSPSAEVSGIAVAFMPTYDVIKETIGLGANLLITHEGIFFSHGDKSESGAIYDEKHKLIEDSGLAIFRCHDYIHKYQPDGITQGLILSLGWESFVEKNLPVASVMKIPEMTVKEIAEHVKRKLELNYVRVVGNISTRVTRIGIFAGFRGGGDHVIPLMEEENLDLVIYGEGPEWETPEFVRDSVSVGQEKAVIVLGHAESEEPGMKHFAKELERLFPVTPVHFIPVKPNFKVL